MNSGSSTGVLGLKAGDWVEVRSQGEILSTLDSRGCLNNLPFMPEMVRYCGRRFRVFKRADKTCDNIAAWSIRRMKDAVHLEGLRCDGSVHGGCEAGCLIYWDEAWLRRADAPAENPLTAPVNDLQPAATRLSENLIAASRTTSPDGESIYFCQATEVRNFTSEMRWWDLRQYVRDVRSGNLSTGLADNTRAQHALDLFLAALTVIRSLSITLFNREREKHQATVFPLISGQLEKTPIETSDLEPGELVQVRSKEEIVATLDRQNRNRGLLFDCEMLPYCGGIYRVLRRVHHIIDEKTGKMMHMKYPCIVLEGVVCRSDYHRLCPRSIYSYWREGWLKRAAPELVSAARPAQEIESCRTR